MKLELILKLIIINLFKNISLNNPDNFNSIIIFKTPNHIEPEWYFLFFYSILRSIPNKLRGLILIFISLIIFFFIPLINKLIIQNNKFNYLFNYLNLIFYFILIFISILGSKIIEYPYENLNFNLINIIFLYFIINLIIKLIKFILKIN